MTEELRYKISIGTEKDIDVDNFEEFFQDLLLDLYDHDGVDSITVTKDGYVGSTDEDVEELLNIVEKVDSDALRRAIDSVKTLENIEDNEDDG